MSNIVNIPNPNTVPGKSIHAHFAIPGQLYITEKTRCIIYCRVEYIFHQLDGTRFYMKDLEALFPITLDTLTANFSYEKSLPVWDDDKNWIDGPHHYQNRQPQTDFQIGCGPSSVGVGFYRYNVTLDEAKKIASQFNIAQIRWEGKQMFLVDGIWIGE